MVFPTIEFAAFFVVVLLVSWLLMPTPKYWKPFIFAASLAFYGRRLALGVPAAGLDRRQPGRGHGDQQDGAADQAARRC